MEYAAKESTAAVYNPELNSLLVRMTHPCFLLALVADVLSVSLVVLLFQQPLIDRILRDKSLFQIEKWLHL